MKGCFRIKEVPIVKFSAELAGLNPRFSAGYGTPRADMLDTPLEGPIHYPLKSGSNSKNADPDHSFLKKGRMIRFDRMIEVRNVIILGGRRGLFSFGVSPPAIPSITENTASKST